MTGPIMTNVAGTVGLDWLKIEALSDDDLLELRRELVAAVSAMQAQMGSLRDDPSLSHAERVVTRRRLADALGYRTDDLRHVKSLLRQREDGRSTVRFNPRTHVAVVLDRDLADRCARLFRLAVNVGQLGPEYSDYAALLHKLERAIGAAARAAGLASQEHADVA